MALQQEKAFEKLELKIKQDESGPMIIMTSVFILWGFLTGFTIPLSKNITKVLVLSPLQDGLITFVFFIAYFFVGFLFYLFIKCVHDPFKTIGYKKIVVIGLSITAIGCFLFYPAAELSQNKFISPDFKQDLLYGFTAIVSLSFILILFTKKKKIALIGLGLTLLFSITLYFSGFLENSTEISKSFKFNLFLTTMFVLAAGFAVLQIAANPYVIQMGANKNASTRINLAQGFNSVGATLAPVISTLYFVTEADKVNISSIELPYLTIGLAIILLAFLFNLSVLPDIQYTELEQRKNNPVKNELQLLLGVFAIFLYVGGEVSIAEHLEDYFNEISITGFDGDDIKNHIALYWGGAMLGRFAGAIFLSTMEKRNKRRVLIFLTLLCYFLALGTTGNSNHSLIFTGLFFVNLFGFRLGKGRSTLTLGLFGIFIISAIVISIISSGDISLWSIIIIGMFNSIMFPSIFRITIRTLKEKTSLGSSLLVMAIAGGALIPAIQDVSISALKNIDSEYQVLEFFEISPLQLSFLIPTACYVFIAYYGFKSYRSQQV